MCISSDLYRPIENRRPRSIATVSSYSTRNATQ
uniref:Uncharacterized protein n=1 Tax=Arundo donax TaxID=35708 RepID=A0A0A9GLP1_ARUDO